MDGKMEDAILSSGVYRTKHSFHAICLRYASHGISRVLQSHCQVHYKSLQSHV